MLNNVVLFADKSLTVDSVTKVMEMVPADRLAEAWEQLGVPKVLVEIMSEKFSTTKDKTRACVDLYLCNPDREPSWGDISCALYKYGEMAAAREAKSFLDHDQNGEQCHLCIKSEK